MEDTGRLVPELLPGASLLWYAFQLDDGSITQKMARAIEARRAGEAVRLIPKTYLAAYFLRSVYRSASRT